VALERIELPTKLRTIGEKAFAGCSSLASLAIPAGLESFSSDALVNCSALKSISVHGVNISSGICGALDFEGFPHAKDVVITVDTGCVNETVCGRVPYAPTATPSGKGMKVEVLVGIVIGSVCGVAAIVVCGILIRRRILKNEEKSKSAFMLGLATETR
jgi:hypothetical protein